MNTTTRSTIVRILAAIALLCLLTSGSAEACTCKGKAVPCREECIQVCTQDGVSADLCEVNAGEFLLNLGKETASWKKLREAAPLISEQEHSEMILTDEVSGQTIRVPGRILKPFVGITLNVKGATTVDVLQALATVTGVKLDIAANFSGTVAVNARDSDIRDVLDNLCEAKWCAWSLVYSRDGWLLRVAGEAGKAEN